LSIVNNPIITAYTLRNLLMCERRVWLDRQGDLSQRDELPQYQMTAGKQHEQMVSTAMFGPATPVPAASWDDMVHETRHLMERGVGGIQGAAFERTIQFSQPIVVRGRVDWLRRIAQPSALGKWSYEPIEIKLRQERNAADLLQLDLYLWLLEGIQASETSGWFWMGRDTDNQPLQIIEHSYNPARLFSALERVDSILSADSAPSIFLAKHCETCHWHTSCKQAASAGRDLSALAGLPRQTWEHMRMEGINTLDHLLALSPRDLQRFKGLGKSKAQDIYTYAQAVSRGQPIQRDALPQLAQQTGIMLDLETCIDGKVGVPWCWGWQIHGDQFQVAIVDSYYDEVSLLLPDGLDVMIVSDSDEGWRAFTRVALEHSGPIYHWGSFEKGVLRSTAPAEVIEVLDDRLHDLNRTFKRTFVFPVHGTSIKTVAPYLGFRWPPGTSAFSAWDDYRAWLMDGDKMALTRACAYNRADVEAMALVWQWMIDHQQISSDNGTGG
jgi:predicted RecB family nuclease